MDGPWTIKDILEELRRQMDPQACLDRAAAALDEGDLEEAGAALDDYKHWRARGGFEPAGGDARAAELWQQLQQRLKQP